MKFLDVFNEIDKGNYALTDEAVYSSIQNNDKLIPLYGGNKNHTSTDRMISVSAKTKKGTSIRIFSGEGIIISLDGSAGNMTYKRDEEFALNHHAGFITLRDSSTNIVNLEYFALFLQNFYKNISVSDGSKTLSLEQIYSEEFELPSYETQCTILSAWKKTKEKIDSLMKYVDCCNELLKKQLTVDYNNYQGKAVPISRCIDYMSGNSGLTEEFIYQKLQVNTDPYIVLSSSTEDRTLMGKIPMCTINDKPLKVFEGKNGLLVSRNGKAGTTRYLPSGKYTINDHAYILYVKDDSPYDIDLRWLALQYKSEFLQYSSNSDNGTWNMTGFFKQTKIDIPDIEEQNALIEIYERLTRFKKAFSTLDKAVSTLFEKQVS